MGASVKCVLRVRYSKTGAGRYTSHLDMVRMWGRILRRSGLPVEWSDGYVSRPGVQFGPPLPLGMESRAEYVDINLLALPGNGVLGVLDRCMPRYFQVLDTWCLEPEAPPPDSGELVAGYAVCFGEEEAEEKLKRALERLEELETVIGLRYLNDHRLKFKVPLGSRKNRPDVILDGLLGKRSRVEKEEVFIKRGADDLIPMKILSKDMEKKFFES
ncbi:MAG: DUF2344 domain-containing protein [Candidatus Aegiribacteria sp.]|nr:DUF2344 domain-containing protein [Candidatus Aegiribacteria sp.]MBD3294878.1 DUF2344 domain-containing protein [Candidatus Fermentibacteria bacterium]